MVVTDISKSNKSPQLNDQQIKDLVDIRSPIQTCSRYESM
jgi:hypothetical protein